MRIALLSLVLVSASCFDPTFPDSPECGGTGKQDCPPGLECLVTTNHCVRPGCVDIPEGADCFGGSDVPAGICHHTTCVTRGCGDGSQEPGEVCDDGNTTSGDGCAGNCLSTEFCGNSIPDFAVGEQCDPGPTSTPTCRGPDSAKPCTIPTCGDGLIDPTNGEECDDGSSNSQDANANCRLNCVTAHCGDGVLDDAPANGRAPEVCDDNNTRSGDGCSADCLSDETCGNAYVDTIKGEQCDSGLPFLSGDGCTSGCLPELAQWSNITPSALTARFAPALAFDGARHVMMLFGGTGLGQHTFGDTWKLVDDHWQQLFPSVSPQPRRAHALVYDPDLQKMFMFGGRSESAALSDTWLFDGDDWIEVSPAVTPPARFGHGLTYDSLNHQVVMFGGFDTSGASLTDTWTFAGSAWTPVITTSSPPGGSWKIVFDPAIGRTVLFGFDRTGTAQTWTFDGSDWAPIAASGPPNTDFVLTFDSGSSDVQFTAADQIWRFDGTSWREVATLPPPQPTRFLEGLAFDPDAHRFVMFGGVSNNNTGDLNDTWSLTGTTWSQLPSFAAPAPRESPASAYDANRGHIIMFGGDSAPEIAPSPSTTFGDTWLFEPGGWQQVSGASPPPRTGATMAYFAPLGGVVMFGGTSSTNRLFDTWLFGNSWSQIATTNWPDATGAMAFDSDNNVLVEFDGYDTWTFNGIDWSIVPIFPNPPFRADFAMAYDELHHEIVMFGGTTLSGGTPELNDTWVFSNDTWTQMQPSNAPLPRARHTMAYDPVSQRVLMFGGDLATNILDDLWAWDGAEWTQIRTPLSPLARAASAFAFDRARDQFTVMLGEGPDAGGLVSDTWTFDLRGVTPVESCNATADADGDGAVGCADPDCAGFCTPTCGPFTDHYDHRPVTANHPAAPHCDLTSAPFCGDRTCQSPLENPGRCPQDCP